MRVDDLIRGYKERKQEISERLKDFERVWQKGDKEIFAELCFCICTPQSRAVFCDKAVMALKKNKALYLGGFDAVRKELKAVRFPNNKARFIIEARKLFMDDGKLRIKNKIDPDRVSQTRLWFFENVKGLGLKESSHFLRNIGFGHDLAILDVHILRRMVDLGIIKEMPAGLNEKTYLQLEEKLKVFSKEIGIPMAELDILFWSMATGIIFK